MTGLYDGLRKEIGYTPLIRGYSSRHRTHTRVHPTYNGNVTPKSEGGLVTVLDEPLPELDEPIPEILDSCCCPCPPVLSAGPLIVFGPLQ